MRMISVALGFGIVLCLTFNSASAANIPWTTTETSIFSPDPTESIRPGSAVWSENNLTLTYDGTQGYMYAESVGQIITGPGSPLPSIVSPIIPTDTIGFSFDFTHSGYFLYSQVQFGYYIPSFQTGVGVNTSYQAIISNTPGISPYLQNSWFTSVGGIGTDAPFVSQSNNGEAIHVEFYFSQQMLQYQDGAIYLLFQGSGSADSTIGLGVQSFSNVSWIVSEGSSSSVTRWHFGDAESSGGGTPVPEPNTMLQLGTGIAVLIAVRRKKTA